MADQETINTDVEIRLRKAEAYIIEHEARINEKWLNQEKWNTSIDAAISSLREHIDTKFGAVFLRLSKLEVRVATFAGIAALVGSAAVKYLFP